LKNSVKILSVIILVAFYFYSLGVMNTSHKITDNYGNPKSEKKFYFSDFSANLFIYTLQKESSANNYYNISASKIKFKFNNPLAIIKTTKHLFDSAFFQYTHISMNFLIQLRITVFIFPFNYFW